MDRRRQGRQYQGGLTSSGIALMFRRDTPAESHFRIEVRTWLEANLPLALRGRTARPPPAELMPWYQALSRQGWIAPHWPKHHGGMGATLNEQIIITEELARIGAPQLPAQRSKAIISSCGGRRSGPPGDIIRTGCLRWSAPTRGRSRGKPASASC